MMNLEDYKLTQVNFTYNYYFPKLKVIFCHMPGSGGSFISRFLYMREHNLSENETSRDYKICNRLTRFIKIRVTDLHIYKDQGIYIFSLVRDPISRMLSLYKRFRLQLPLEEKNWRLAIPDEGPETFKRFVDCLIKQTDNNNDVHWVSQHDLLSHNGKLQQDHIGRFEHFQHEILNICNVLKVKVPSFQKVNYSKDIDIEILPESIEKIRCRYYKDYELLKFLEDKC